MISAFVLALTAVLVSVVPLSADDDFSIERRLSDPVYMSWVSEPSVAACIQCHFDGPGLAVVASGQAGKLNAFSRREEMDAWVNQDKHTIARRRVEPLSPSGQEAELMDLFDRLQERTAKVVVVYRKKGVRLDTSKIGMTEVPEEWVGTSNILSRRICDKLWGENSVETTEGYSKFRDACLTCHGGVMPNDPRSDAPRPEGVLSKQAIGIDCLFCHQEGTQDSWQKKHFDNTTWRLSSPEKKRSQGMSDLVNTAKQASLCLDCHVGNRDRNMFVTHQMYAAGHPPLPSIEVQTYCEQMPQHWQTPSQLHKNLAGEKSREEYFQINYPGVVGPNATLAGKTFWDTRKVFIGSLVARQKAVQLMVQSALLEQWGDYALYDCAACHHELLNESHRQQRYLTSSQSNVPGRPRQHEWQGVLLDVAYRLSGKKHFVELNRLESELRQSFNNKPFGDANTVVRVGGQLTTAIDKAVDSMQERPFNGALAKLTMRVVSETNASELLTYDAARQVVWAVEVMAKELQREGITLSESTSLALEQLTNPQLTGLDTKLPAGRKQFIYPDHLGREFERRVNYDPDSLARLLNAMVD